MRSPVSSMCLPYCFALLLTVSASSLHELESVGRRVLMSFKETPKGSNRTFECSPSGPCVPCLYSEKNDERYRCSETGYRIPLKCEKVQENMKDANGQKTRKSRSTLEISFNTRYSTKHRSLEEDPSREGGPLAYITYRSCIPAISEEKLSVLGFEGIILCLLMISGAGAYFRRKRTVAMPGVAAGRIQSNSRL